MKSKRKYKKQGEHSLYIINIREHVQLYDKTCFFYREFNLRPHE